MEQLPNRASPMTFPYLSFPGESSPDLLPTRGRGVGLLGGPQLHTFRKVCLSPPWEVGGGRQRCLNGKLKHHFPNPDVPGCNPRSPERTSTL